MAILEPPAPFGGIKIEENAPKGSHIAVCILVDDQFGVERRKYQSDEMEKQNVTRFYFGLKGKDGKTYVVRTREMKISGDPKANLVKFLASWNGEAFPYGIDYCKWAIGRGAQITVAHNPSKTKPGVVYADITGIVPVMEGLEDRVPKLAEFAHLLKRDEAGDTSASKTSTQDAGEEDAPF